MVSHVDDDHVRGLLDLTSELRDALGVPFVQIANFWHNTFDDVIGKNPRELTAAVTAQFGAAALSGEILPEMDEPCEEMRDTFKILASVERGHRLRGDIAVLGAPRNVEYDGDPSLGSTDTIQFDAGLTFILVRWFPTLWQPAKTRVIRQSGGDGKSERAIATRRAIQGAESAIAAAGNAGIRDRAFDVRDGIDSECVVEHRAAGIRTNPRHANLIVMNARTTHCHIVSVSYHDARGATVTYVAASASTSSRDSRRMCSDIYWNVRPVR